jgi:hypothetical protein
MPDGGNKIRDYPAELIARRGYREGVCPQRTFKGTRCAAFLFVLPCNEATDRTSAGKPLPGGGRSAAPKPMGRLLKVEESIVLVFVACIPLRLP